MPRTDVRTPQPKERDKRPKRLERGGAVFTGEQMPNVRIVRQLQRPMVKAAVRLTRQEYQRKDGTEGAKSADVQASFPAFHED